MILVLLVVAVVVEFSFVYVLNVKIIWKAWWFPSTAATAFFRKKNHKILIAKLELEFFYLKKGYLQFSIYLPDIGELLSACTFKL